MTLTCIAYKKIDSGIQSLLILIHSLTLIMLIHYLALRGLWSEAVWTGLGLRYVFVLRTFFQYEVLHALTNKYCCCNHYLYSSQHSFFLYLYASSKYVSGTLMIIIRRHDIKRIITFVLSVFVLGKCNNETSTQRVIS